MQDLWTDIDHTVLQTIAELELNSGKVHFRELTDHLAPRGIAAKEITRSLDFLREQGSICGDPSPAGKYELVSLAPAARSEYARHMMPDYQQTCNRLVRWLADNLGIRGQTMAASQIAEQIGAPLPVVIEILRDLHNQSLIAAESTLGPPDVMVSARSETLRRMSERG